MADPSGARGQDEAHALFLECLQLSESGQFDLACDCYLKVVQIDPQYAQAHNNLGLLHYHRGNLKGATESFTQAVRLAPSLVEPHLNLGNIAEGRGDLKTALTYYEAALLADPQFAPAKCYRATTLLALGQYKAGWEELYEWNLATEKPVKYSRPRWDGSQEICGKCVLLLAVYGFGDAIQFIRYAALVAARGAHVILECREALKSLFKSAPGVHFVVTKDQPLPEFDYYVPLVDLPYIFRTTPDTIPAHIPYLFSEPKAVEQWKRRVVPYENLLKIGLVWAAGPLLISDKSCSAEQLASLISTPGSVFFSLQKGDAASQVREFGDKGQKVIDYTDEIRDFEDTAALIAALDLVISVDTSVAHLAGALGKPVWIMLPFAPDWRWHPLSNVSEWYPTARLFRQRLSNNWHSVVNEIKSSLTNRVSQGGPL